MSVKVKAGRYVVKTSHDTLIIKNVAAHKWVVLRDSGDRPRMIGDPFITKRAAEEWVASLKTRPATNRSIGYLKRLFNLMAGDPFAERVRASLNEHAGRGEPLTQELVSMAITHLTRPETRPRVPAPREVMEPFASRAEAIAFTRAAIEGARG